MIKINTHIIVKVPIPTIKKLTLVFLIFINKQTFQKYKQKHMIDNKTI